MLRPVAFALLLVSHSALALGQQPSTPADRASSTTRLIPITAVVTDAVGTPVRGTVSVTFTLYDAQDSGELLWTETQQVNADERGRYTAYLGTVTPLPQPAFSQETARWLGVEIDGRQLPRVMLVAVPYALRAVDADTLGGTPLSSFVTRAPDGRLQTTAGDVSEPLVDGTGIPGQLAKFTGTTVVGSSIITETATNRIGIATTDPTEGGLLDSKVTIRATDGGTALAVANQSGSPRFALNINADGSWITYDRATGIYQPGIAQRGGRVGIATTDPTGGGVVDSKFTVRNLDNNTGIAVLNEANARRFALNTLASGAWTMYDGWGNAWWPGLTQMAGRVGLGTTAPESRLDIRGAADALTAVSTGGMGIFASGSATNSYGVYATGFLAVSGNSTAPGGIGVIGGGALYGVQGSSGGSGTGVYGTGGSYGVRGVSSAASGVGVRGEGAATSTSTGVVGTGGQYGVRGSSITDTGVYGSGEIYGVVGITTGLPLGGGAGVYGQAVTQGGSNFAGLFVGNVTVTGTLTKGGGAFQIDHPLDPANKYLSHSFVESPDMMNVYNGNVMLDSNGDAWVTLPEWFEALNRDFRYQLTPIGGPGPNLHVAVEVSANRFKIGGGTPGAKVSWQVTGIRQDAWANANRILVEQDKPANERGYYLHPRAFNLDETVLVPSLRVEPRENRNRQQR